MKRRSGFTLIEVLLAIALIALVVMGYMIWNMNQRMGQYATDIETINAKGRRLTEWATVSAKYTKHDNEEHDKDAPPHSKATPPSHIPPPPPPDTW